MMRPFDSLSAHYLDRALDEAGGTNVVNVVIVDFRGFDTFGETMVMAAAGLVIHALVGDRRLNAVSGPARAGLPMQPEHRLPVLLTTLASHLLPFALMVSVYFYLRGHNLPGGGFIAGLITAIALLLQHVSFGARAFIPTELDADQAMASQSRLWHRVVGAGLLIATLTGLGSWVFDYPFLTSTFGHPHLPLIGEVPLASAAAFDLGVYLAVVGATLLALGALSRLGRRP
jgi:multicomponent K+:H+ antiporter subunit A